MVEQKRISRFFLALVSAGGEMTRKDLAVKVFSRNWNAKQLDELLAVPLLAGLIVESRERVRATGRHPRRYILTPSGFTLAHLWQLPIKSATIAPEEVQHQFSLLLQAGNPWAKGLERDANAWRAHEEKQRLLRLEKAEADKEKRKQEEANRVKYPSAGRNRSEKDLAARSRYVASKIEERTSPSVIAPTPVRVPTPSPAARPFVDLNENYVPPRGGFSQPSARPVSPPVAPTRIPQSDLGGDCGQYGQYDPKDLADIRKLNDLGRGFKTKNDCVWYNNSQWLQIREWKKRMPGYID